MARAACFGRMRGVEDEAGGPHVIEDFETRRLSVRHWRPDLRKLSQLEAALAPVFTPEVLAPLPPPLQAVEPFAAWAAARAAESEVFIARRGGEVVGLLIIATDRSDEVPAVRLGYLIAAPFWGQGFASELLEGLVASLRGPVRLVGGVARGNAASARVLVKQGFALAADQPDADVEVYVREIGE